MPEHLRLCLTPEAYRSDDLAWLGRIASRCRSGGTDLEVELVIRGPCSAHGPLAGEGDGLGRALEVARRVARADARPSWRVDVSPTNVYQLEGVYRCARDHDIPVAFALETPETEGFPRAGPGWLRAPRTALFLEDFVRHRLLPDSSVRDPRCGAHRRLLDNLRAAGGAGQQDGERALARDVVPPAEAPAVRVALEERRPAPVREVARRAGGKLEFLLEAGTTIVRSITGVVRGRMAGRDGRSRRSVARPGESLPRALLVGAYGGEHVGDAAILGGVLLRLHERHRTRHATVASLRPEYTRRWLEEIDTPVEARVIPYRSSLARRVLRESDVLVFAGGPLMDLPPMLARHVDLAAVAAAEGKPFVMDRIGIGPFRRRVSRWLAGEILGLATDVTLRTRGAAEGLALDGLEVRVDRDPAFEYLATRSRLTRLTASERASVDDLLAGTGGRPRIAVNVRPIRHLWTESGREHSVRVENRFLEELAAALVDLAAAWDRDPVFLFFPMNPIPFGSSDLHSAYRLHRLLGAGVDFRVWENNPGIDGVLHFLRQVDAAVTMRFHASIFALSQELPVLGVDYYVGRDGKVSRLFGDLGRASDCRRIDRFESAWLKEGLERSLASTTGGDG